MKGISKIIKKLLLERQMSQTTIAEHLKMTLQNFNNKLRRDSFTEDEIKKIAKIMNATFHHEKAWFTLNDTGEDIR